MLKNRIAYILLIISLAVIYIFTNTYYTLILLVSAVFLIVFSLVLMILSGRGLNISLNMPQTMSKDHDCIIEISTTNESIVPVARVGITISITNMLTNSNASRRMYCTVGSKQNDTAKFKINGAKAGETFIGLKKIKVYDCLGLFSFKMPDLQEISTIIYPKSCDISIQTEKPIETTGDGTRYSQSKKGADVSEIFALREYVPGDEVRKIHWKLSSKLDKLVVRDFSLPLNYSVFLLLELIRGTEDELDACLSVYTSLSRTLLENGINHNLAWYDGKSDVFYIKEAANFDSLEVSIAQILSASSYSDGFFALDGYTSYGRFDKRHTLMYVTTKIDVDKLTELSSKQRVKTLYISEDGENEFGNVDILAVSTSKINEIPEILV